MLLLSSEKEAPCKKRQETFYRRVLWGSGDGAGYFLSNSFFKKNAILRKARSWCGLQVERGERRRGYCFLCELLLKCVAVVCVWGAKESIIFWESSAAIFLVMSQYFFCVRVVMVLIRAPPISPLPFSSPPTIFKLVGGKEACERKRRGAEASGSYSCGRCGGGRRSS